MEITIKVQVMPDASPQLLAALSEMLAALGNGVQQPEVRQPEAVAQVAAAPEVNEPKPSIVTDAELRALTSAAVNKVGHDLVLAILKEVGDTNRIVALSQEERNVFVERLAAL